MGPLLLLALGGPWYFDALLQQLVLIVHLGQVASIITAWWSHQVPVELIHSAGHLLLVRLGTGSCCSVHWAQRSIVVWYILRTFCHCHLVV